MIACALRPGGIALTVRVTPKGGRDRIDGVVGDAAERPMLAVRVSAAPADGAANAAVVALLAATLGVARRDVNLLSGATSRVKRLEIGGNPHVLATRLAAALGKAGTA